MWQVHSKLALLISSPCMMFTWQGGEFIGQNFQWLLDIFSIKDVCSTSKNPQSNTICERMHQTVNNVLRTLVHTYPPQNMTHARDIIRWCTGHCNACHMNHRCYYFREYFRWSCFFSRHVFECATDCWLAGLCTYSWTSCQWEFMTCQ